MMRTRGYINLNGTCVVDVDDFGHYCELEETSRCFKSLNYHNLNVTMMSWSAARALTKQEYLL